MDIFYVNIYFEDQLDSAHSIAGDAPIATPGANAIANPIVNPIANPFVNGSRGVRSALHPQMVRLAGLNYRFAYELAQLCPRTFFFVPRPRPTNRRLPFQNSTGIPKNLGGLRSLYTLLASKKPTTLRVFPWAPSPSYGRFADRVKEISSALNFTIEQEPAFSWPELAHWNAKPSFSLAWHSRPPVDQVWQETLADWAQAAQSARAAGVWRVKRAFGQMGRYQKVIQIDSEDLDQPIENKSPVGLPGLRYVGGPPQAGIYTDGGRQLAVEPEVDIVLEFARQYQIGQEGASCIVRALPGFTIRRLSQKEYLGTTWVDLEGNADTLAHGLRQLEQVGFFTETELRKIHNGGVKRNADGVRPLWTQVAQQLHLLASFNFLQFIGDHCANYLGHCAVDSFIYRMDGRLCGRGPGEMNTRRTLGVLARDWGRLEHFGPIRTRHLPNLFR